MGTDLPSFVGSWTVMMAAMMLPSAMPMIRLHRLGADGSRREVWSAVFIMGYLLVWAAVGIAVWGASLLGEMVILPEQRAIAVAALLLVAGIYQFTPLKSACLRACRTPADFLMTHWQRGLAGQLRLGLEHGLYCVGCCWALMAIFVGVGAMSIAWAAAIAGVVLIEKIFPRGVAFGRVLGAILVAASFVVFVRPDLVAGVGTQM
jgi:predicted metal-binding membrane protein